MLESIVEYLRIKLQALNVGTVYGLGELVEQQGQQYPAIYIGSGQYQHLADFDNNTGSIYFRLVAPVSNSTAEGLIGGDDTYQRAYQLRIVAFVPKSVYNTDNNYIDDKIAHNIQAAIQSDDDGLLSESLKAQGASIEVSSYETNRNNVLGNEIINTLFENIPFEYAFISVDFTVTITGSPSCFETYGCNDEFIDYIQLLRDLVCESECQDATVTATNSLGDIVGQTTASSGGTGNISIPDSSIKRSNGTEIVSVPATEPATIVDSVVTIQQQDGTPISINNVMAATNVTLLVPNPPVCQDGTAVLTDQFGNSLGSITVASGATENETVTLPCASFSSFTDQFGTSNAFSVMAAFGSLSISARSVAVNGNFIYLLNFGNIEKVNATTFASVSSITGFGFAVEIAFSPDGSQYAVVDFNGSRVRIMDTATDTQIAVWSSLTNPYSICYNPTGTELLVATLNTTTITRYDLTGASLGTVAGFDGVIHEIRRSGLNYYVTTANGVSGGSTQRVRVMDFATNTQQASYNLGTVNTIGGVLSLVIEGSVAWITTSRANGSALSLSIIEYGLTFVQTRSQILGMVANTAIGLAYNGNTICPSLVVVCPNALTAFSIKI